MGGIGEEEGKNEGKVDKNMGFEESTFCLDVKKPNNQPQKDCSLLYSPLILIFYIFPISLLPSKLHLASSHYNLSL